MSRETARAKALRWNVKGEARRPGVAGAQGTGGGEMGVAKSGQQGPVPQGHWGPCIEFVSFSGLRTLTGPDPYFFIRCLGLLNGEQSGGDKSGSQETTWHKETVVCSFFLDRSTWVIS